MNEIKSVTDSVSIIIPVLNEVDSLPLTIESLLGNGYPKENLEFVLVDGGSTDGTLDYIENLLNLNLDVKLVHNEHVLTAHAMNLGIESAKHGIILRADAHAYFHGNYILFSVECLKKGLGDNVGGKLIAKANKTPFSQILALVLNSPIGNGAARYRKKDFGALVDTVWCGCWYKDILIREGMFDPLWVRNQDAELNSRFLSQDLKIYSDPRIVAELVVRQTYLDMLLQYYGYGKGRIMTMLRYPHFVKLRQIIPMLAVLMLFSLTLMEPTLSLIVTISMVIVSVFFYRRDIVKIDLNPMLLIWVVPIVLGMNVSWVLGCIVGGISAAADRLFSFKKN